MSRTPVSGRGWAYAGALPLRTERRIDRLLDRLPISGPLLLHRSPDLAYD